MPHTPTPANSAPVVRAREQEHSARWLLAMRRKLERNREFRREQLAAFAAPIDGVTGPTRTTVEESVRNPALREITATVTGGAREALAKIEEALAGMVDGSYGRCRSCRNDIPVALLEAIPETLLCLECQRSFGNGRAQHRSAGRYGYSGRRSALHRRSRNNR